MGKIKEIWKKMKPLVLFQLSDKLDFAWMKSKKNAIRKIVFAIAKFAIIVGVISLLLWLFNYL